MNGWIRLQQMKHWGLKCKMQGVYLICYSFKMKICSLTWISNFPVLRYVRPLQLGLFPEQWNKWKTASLPGNTVLTAFCQPSGTVLMSAPEKTTLLLEGLLQRNWEWLATNTSNGRARHCGFSPILMCMVRTDSNWFKEDFKNPAFLTIPSHPITVSPGFHK